MKKIISSDETQYIPGFDNLCIPSKPIQEADKIKKLEELSKKSTKELYVDIKFKGIDRIDYDITIVSVELPEEFIKKEMKRICRQK